MKGKILAIGGSDSGGGAGIQADTKTITTLGGYASTVICALTAQNTLGVKSIFEVPAKFVAEQMRMVLDDIGADMVKTGMLLNTEIIKIVASEIGNHKLVLDPVMVAKGGHSLLKEEAISTLKTELIPKALLVTPNIPEAKIITQMPIDTPDDMTNAGKVILGLGAKYALIKGGHLEGNNITDVLVGDDFVTKFESNRVDSNNTHGTGCTLASAISTYIAQGGNIEDSVKNARDYVYEAIKTAPDIGTGQGPLNHSPHKSFN